MLLNLALAAGCPHGAAIPSMSSVFQQDISES